MKNHLTKTPLAARALAAGIVMLVLSIMGFVHASRAGDELIGAPARALDPGKTVPPTV